MKADDLEELEAAEQLRLKDEFRAAFPLFRFTVRLDTTMFLANQVDVKVLEAGDSAYFEVTLTDAWAWGANLPVRTQGKVLVHTFDTVVIGDRRPA